MAEQTMWAVKSPWGLSPAETWGDYESEAWRRYLEWGARDKDLGSSVDELKLLGVRCVRVRVTEFEDA